MVGVLSVRYLALPIHQSGISIFYYFFITLDCSYLACLKQAVLLCDTSSDCWAIQQRDVAEGSESPGASKENA